MAPDGHRELERRVSQIAERDLRITSRLSGGQHALTVIAEAADGTELVVRAFPTDDPAVERELQVLQRLEGQGLGDWVPRLIAHTTDASMPIIITTRVRGGHPTPDLPGALIAEQMAHALARIHDLDGDGLRDPALEPPTGTVQAAVTLRRAWPQLDLSERVLTHSDFWCGNALWDGPALTGVVDWVGAHRAPRGVDIAWCRLDLVLLGERGAADRFLDEYERKTGAAVNDHQLWDLLAAARAEEIVETWTPNYHDIGRSDLVPKVLRRRLDSWTSTLVEQWDAP